MKRALRWLSGRLQDAESAHLPPDKIRRFVLEGWRNLTRLTGGEARLDDERLRLGECLARLGWLEQAELDGLRMPPAPALETERALAWLAALPEKIVVHRHIVAAGSAQHLAALAGAGYSDEVARQMEALLRHVEVRRRACLRVFSPAPDEGQAWLERLDIAILFSRRARAERDLRYMNAALKINETWFGCLRRTRDPLLLARLCLCLAEQELSARELLA